MGCFCSKEAPIEESFPQQGPAGSHKSSKGGQVADEATKPPENVAPPAVGTPREEGRRKQVQVTKTMGKSQQQAMGSTPPAGRSGALSSWVPSGLQGELVAAGWPPWLVSVAGEAINGWLPRKAESFEKLEKIGQGTYSSVFKACDLVTGKIVAMKQVRFVSTDVESVRFMAREINVLRRLDHPNVLKLKCLVTSRVSNNLYLVFNYMEHDLAGLAATPGRRFTEPQVKCFMQQLLRGLEHCHSRGILHRDIKGSNLLVDNNGILRIADFGLATIFNSPNKTPMTSRVVTLWYRPPELLLGTTDYGVAVDLWSAGCILAELLLGKPIMPGRTEVEQMHKIFKLCGSPSDNYWRKIKSQNYTAFKPQQPYKRRVAETFKDFPPSGLAIVEVLLAIEPQDRGTASSALKSQFFTTKPLPCDPSALPKYPPSKEYDFKLRDEEARRQKAESVRRAAESTRVATRAKPAPDTSVQVYPLFQLKQKPQAQGNPRSTNAKFDPQRDVVAGFPIDPAGGEPILRNKNQFEEGILASGQGPWDTISLEQKSHTPPNSYKCSDAFLVKDTNHRCTRKDVADPSRNYQAVSSKQSKGESASVAGIKKRIHCSGPLLLPGGNIEDMLNEHERQIREVERKARLDKNKKN